MTKEFKNITDYLYEFNRTQPEKLAFLHPQKITYKNFCALTDFYSSGFQKSGITKGTKTIVLIKPSIDLFATTFALLRIGAIPVMIDPGMGIKAMIKALAKTNAGAFIGIPKTLLIRYIYKKEFSSVRVWISTGINLNLGAKNLPAFRRQKNSRYFVASTNKNDEVAVFFTSGSTGPAKGVVYKNFMFEAQLNYLKGHFKYNPEETDLCTFPLIGLFSVCLGLSVVLADMDMTHPARLKPKKIFENINRFNCTYMFCSPMVLKKIADYGTIKNLKLLSIKKILTAGASVLPELLKNMKSLISKEALIHTPYGATEALPITDLNHKELLELYRDDGYLNGICVGYPLENIKLKIIKITDGEINTWNQANECYNGEVGEIVINGENVTQNYLDNISADKLSKIEDSATTLFWHRTSDLGRLDESGRVWFYGRKSHRVETGNKILFTIPVEEVFNRHQAVERSALVGVKKNNITEPVVCIQIKAGFIKNLEIIEELETLARESGYFSKQVIFLFHKKFPVDPRHNAKIFREKLAEWAQTKIK